LLKSENLDHRPPRLRPRYSTHPPNLYHRPSDHFTGPSLVSASLHLCLSTRGRTRRQDSLAIHLPATDFVPFVDVFIPAAILLGLSR